MRNNPILPIFAIALVDIIAFTIILPLLPFYTLELGASPLVIGMLISAFGLSQFLSAPVLGHLSDRWGRKPVLLISQFGTCAGLVLLAVSRCLPLVFLARIIDGITAGNITVAQAYIVDVTPIEKRAKAFGIFGSAFGIGMFIGPALSGLLARQGMQYPIWCAAALSALSIVGTATLLKKKPKTVPASDAPAQKRRYRELSPIYILMKYIKVPVLRPFLFQHLCFSFAFMVFVSGLALFCASRFSWHGHAFGPEQTGYVLTYSGIMGLIIQGGLIHGLVKRFGERKLIVFGFLSMFVAFGIMSGVYAIPVFILCLTVNNIGVSVLRPTILTEVSKLVPRTEQGAVMGVLHAIQSLTQIAAPLVSGFLIDRGLFSAWSWTSSIICGVGLLSAAKVTLQDRYARKMQCA